MPKLVARIRQILTENKSEVHRFLKFAVVGSIGFIVDFSLLNVGIQIFGLEKWEANTISFTAAVISNFFWNRYWTYPESRADRFGPQFLQFFLVNLGGFAINQAVFLSLSNYVFTDWGSWGYNIAKIIATAIVMLWNFFVNRKWTYGKIK